MPATVGLHVVDHPGTGGGADVTVVLVHGSLDRASSFARVVRRLPDLHVVTYDRRGYHRSRPALPAAAGLADHIADLVALVGAGPAVVVGHSLGGDVALGAALAAPGPVLAVGAYEPPMPWLEWWPRRRGEPDEDPGRFAEGFFRRLAGDASWDRLGEGARAERRADGPALLAELTALRRPVAPFDVAALTVPAVLARGERSKWHQRRGVEELLATVPDAELVEIPGAGHGAHVSHPDAFAGFVRRVLRRVRPDAPGASRPQEDAG
ncbi:MAG: alpha/beta fold hydrolase [Acidimicrobiales bacterium]